MTLIHREHDRATWVVRSPAVVERAGRVLIVWAAAAGAGDTLLLGALAAVGLLG